MTHAKWLGLGGIVLVALGAACSAQLGSESLSDSRNGSPSGSNEKGSSSGGASGNEPGAATDLGPTDNGVILVHAAGAPPFRLCFQNDLIGKKPVPSAELMPEANVVGVEVGSAVRLGPLVNNPGDVYLFSEPVIRVLYPQGEDVGPTCEDLVGGNSSVGYTTLGTISDDLSHGVHLLVVGGCFPTTPARTYSKAECGADFDITPAAQGGKGNLHITHFELKGQSRNNPQELPSQVLHLSQPLESSRSGQALKVSFGDISTPSAVHDSVATDPKLNGPAPSQLTKVPTFDPADVGIYAKRGFRVTVGTKVVAEQSMADVQILSAPRDVPTSYYSTASNYVVLLLGDPAPKLVDGGVDPNPDERRGLHLLAVPVVDPKDVDAGPPATPTGDAAAPSGDGG